MKKYEISQSETKIRQHISLEKTQQTAHHIGSKSDRKKQDNMTSPEPAGLFHFSTGGKPVVFRRCIRKLYFFWLALIYKINIGVGHWFLHP